MPASRSLPRDCRRAWTTLALTLHADGRPEAELAAASPFPRHWLYDERRRLTHKSARINYHR